MNEKVSGLFPPSLLCTRLPPPRGAFTLVFVFLPQDSEGTLVNWQVVGGLWGEQIHKSLSILSLTVFFFQSE